MDSSSFSKLTKMNKAQEGIFMSELIDGSSCNFNLAHFRTFQGPLDAKIIQTAIKGTLCNLPEYFVVPSVYNCEFNLEVRSPDTWEIEIIDFSDEGDPTSSSDKWMQKDRRIPFNFDDGPLFRIVLHKIGQQHFRLYHCVHHILVDGVGLYNLERRIFALYNATTSRL